MRGRCLRWLKLRRTHCEQMSSGLPLIADIARCSRHVAFVHMRRHMFPTGIYLASSVAKKSCISKTERRAASASYLTQWPKYRMPSRRAATLKAS